MTGVLTALKGKGESTKVEVEKAKEQGFNSAQLLGAGYTEPEVGASLVDLRTGGLTAQQATDSGFTPQKMLQSGYSQEEIGDALASLRGGGMSARQAYDGGYTSGAMAAAGYTPTEIGGLLADMRDDGLTAQQAKDSGYTAAQMLLAGYDLEENGGGLSDLRAGGITATQASDILGIPSHARDAAAHADEAGRFRADELLRAGYTTPELGEALANKRGKGMPIEQAHEEGYSPERKHEVLMLRWPARLRTWRSGD